MLVLAGLRHRQHHEPRFVQRYLLVERIGTLSGSRLREICSALEVATDCG
jgi:hypothetical protein